MKLVELRADYTAYFLKRPNRFVAEVKLNNSTVKAHIHDSGRLNELLYKGNKLLLKKAKNKNRKTGWDVIAAKKKDDWILINTMHHREIFLNYITNKKISPINKILKIKPEFKYHTSRLDFLIITKGEKIFVETKGVTLSKNKTAIFPDAPTKRGRKHLNELIEIRERGKKSVIFFLIFLKDAEQFSVNYKTDKKFADKFNEALDKGVKVYKPVFSYDGEFINYEKSI
ncbi:MAG: DNA/RNA nuclease SfsA [Candidatus Mcinerneyibacterium aminivorans]|uniref:Sugar fermentation stimulation protein homolog n=1 Tax=Candidatus Mcinerneyibacterium aminivorans TaxID=2703815 RepID=A0A5D0MB03_9BACT|nr:MAG: DNA/RNA nuclease SfsA [Candidatus Mcinerneyibacterium aminivorans]